MSGPSAEGGQRVVVIALVVNLLIAGFKFVTAGISRSTAMLAEAVHSLADSANQVFLLIGMRRSVRPPDARHPFGYGTETYFWAFIVAGSIFLIGAVVSIWEGVEKLWQIYHGTHRGHGDVRWALLVLGVSIVLELVSLRAALVEFRHLTGGRGLRRTLEDARDPTVLTVLFEDVAALFGLIAALCGVLLTYLTGQPIWDALASVVVGLALAVVAIVLGRDSKSLLIGEAVPADEQRQIIELVAAWPDVLAVVHLRTLHIGPKEVLAALKLRFRRDLTIDDLEQSINGLEAALRNAFPHLRRIYIEPGFDEEGRKA
ncbi:MAG: cation diffusion facilitator family transporter [Myxococcales bacterium]|nr:cation diffusion facilitator family transporter [Myxococcota bacterium]MDW8280917.1 cation diffusion facilitator family transporter [Myxococcales bacterium]